MQWSLLISAGLMLGAGGLRSTEGAIRLRTPPEGWTRHRSAERNRFGDGRRHHRRHGCPGGARHSSSGGPAGGGGPWSLRDPGRPEPARGRVFYAPIPTRYLSDGISSVPPDGFTFRAGVTTVVDAGGAGWRNFPQFKRQVIDRSATRILSFLNIVGHGMKGGPAEQDLRDMDANLTALRVREFPGVIVGIKTAHYRGPEWTAVDRAVEAGRLANVPVMVDFGAFGPIVAFEELVLERLRPGDIYTHRVPRGRADAGRERQSARIPVRGAQARRPVRCGTRQRQLLVLAGGARGRAGFRTALLGTDLHTSSMTGGMKDMSNVMSKFLNMGMSMHDVVLRATWKPAGIVGRTDLGHLTPGAVADVAVFRLLEGNFGFPRRPFAAHDRQPPARMRVDAPRGPGGVGPQWPCRARLGRPAAK